MNDLLTSIKNALQGLESIRPGNVFITPHENYIPASVRPPCIGIKDGPINRRELTGGQLEEMLVVNIVPFVQLLADEASIIGDSAGHQGILKLTADIHAALDQNLLDLPGMLAAFSPLEKGSEQLMDEATTLQRKIITYQYEREVDRP